MKRLIITLLAFTLLQCTTPETKVYNIQLQKITGEWIEEQYILPIDTEFTIGCYRGGYYLAHSLHSRNFPYTVREGIIDFKIK